MASISDVIEGLKILEARGADNVDAQHDILYCGPGVDGELTEEEKAKLKNHGWHFDKEFDCWARFT